MPPPFAGLQRTSRVRVTKMPHGLSLEKPPTAGVMGPKSPRPGSDVRASVRVAQNQINASIQALQVCLRVRACACVCMH